MPCPSNTYTHKHTYTHTYTHTHTPMHFIPNLSYRPHFQPRVFLCRASSHHHCFITPPLPYHTTTTALSHTSLATVCLARTTHMYVYHAYVRGQNHAYVLGQNHAYVCVPRICMCTTHMYVYHAYVCVPRKCMCTTQMYVAKTTHMYATVCLARSMHMYVARTTHTYVYHEYVRVPRICMWPKPRICTPQSTWPEPRICVRVRVHCL